MVPEKEEGVGLEAVDADEARGWDSELEGVLDLGPAQADRALRPLLRFQPPPESPLPSYALEEVPHCVLEGEPLGSRELRDSKEFVVVNIPAIEKQVSDESRHRIQCSPGCLGGWWAEGEAVQEYADGSFLKQESEGGVVSADESGDGAHAPFGAASHA